MVGHCHQTCRVGEEGPPWQPRSAGPVPTALSINPGPPSRAAQALCPDSHRPPAAETPPRPPSSCVASAERSLVTPWRLAVRALSTRQVLKQCLQDLTPRSLCPRRSFLPVDSVQCIVSHGSWGRVG